jgi:hypothetical protein
MFPPESTFIAVPALPMFVNAETAPAEVHLITNPPSPVEIGKLNPDAVGLVVNVFIGTAVVEEYDPVMYMFPPESTVIEFPISLADPLMFVNAETAPAEVHLMTNTSTPVEIGKLNPDAVGLVVNVFIGTAVVDW